MLTPARTITPAEIDAIRKASIPQSPIIIVPHDNPDVDAIVSATTLHHILSQLDIPSRVCLRTFPDEITSRIIAENRLFRPDASTLISSIPKGANIILTDWFAIPDKHPLNKVIAVFDHHPTESSIKGDIVFEEPYTSSTKLIYDVFAEQIAGFDGQLREAIERNVLYTLFVDSNSMKSTRFNEEDLSWMKDACERLEESWEHLVETGYCLNDMTAPAGKLAHNGKKTYNLPNGKAAFISYIMVSNYDHGRDAEFEHEIAEIAVSGGYDYALFMICDLGRDETHVFELAMSDTHNGEGHWTTYNDNLSRAKDVYPELERRNLS